MCLCKRNAASLIINIHTAQIDLRITHRNKASTYAMLSDAYREANYFPISACCVHHDISARNSSFFHSHAAYYENV